MSDRPRTFRPCMPFRIAVVLGIALSAPGCSGGQDSGRASDAAAASATTDTAPATAAPDTARARAASAVERFGERLAHVSLLAPDTVVHRQIRDEYGPLATPSLLESWLRDPSRAPGRAVSSPWPHRIEVRNVRGIGAGTYEVTGDVVYVTSVEAAGGGAARRERIIATVVVNDERGARIAGYERR